LDPGIGLRVVVVLLLLCCSAWCSACETAFVSLGTYRLRKLRDKHPRASQLEFWVLYPDKVLTTLFVCNIILNSLVVVLSASIAYRSSGRVSMVFMTGLAILFVLIAGEIIPKTVAKRFAERIVMNTMGTVKILSIFFEPLNRFLTGIAELFLMPFKIKVGSLIPVLTEEDLRAMISAGEEEGLIEEEEREMIHSIFELGDKMVKEIMVPRVNMVAVEAGTPAQALFSLLVKEGFSRYPVYRESIDTIAGVVYMKDVIARQQGKEESFLVEEVMRPAYFVPETKRVNDLLRELQQQHLQMALVADEYGGTAGLVTMEDLIEEIVGEISDEYLIESGDYQRFSDSSIVVKGSMEIEKANEELGLELPDGDYETVAGFALDFLGKFPKTGERFIYGHKIFIIQEADDTVILSIRIKAVSEE